MDQKSKYANQTKMKQVLVDSSSAIILQKTGLITLLMNLYRPIITESVFKELTRNTYPSSEIFKSYCKHKKLHVQPLNAETQERRMTAIFSLNRGERDTILQYIEGTGDFILLDDGKAARYCSKNNLPFISAILFPRILQLTGELTEAESDQKSKDIIEIGRYSQKIIEMAREMSRNELKNFFPKS